MTDIKTAIILTLNERGEIIGMQDLYDTIQCHNRTHVRRLLRDLENSNEVQVSHNGPGRGLKNVIRRNRNSPGYPSNRDKHQRQVP